MNTYLPNLVTEDGSHGVVDSQGVGATRLQVPLLLHYNKNNAAQLRNRPAGRPGDEVVWAALMVVSRRRRRTLLLLLNPEAKNAIIGVFFAFHMRMTLLYDIR